MKRLLIIALTTLTASSSFAVSTDAVSCHDDQNRVNVSTSRHESGTGRQLQLVGDILVASSLNDGSTAKIQISTRVSTKVLSYWLSRDTKVFYGAMADGRAITLSVFGNMKAMLSIDGLGDELLRCENNLN